MPVHDVSNGPKKSSVSEPSINYAPHGDATAEKETSALAGVYRLVIDHAEKKAVPDGRPDDVERRSDEIDATASIQRTA